MDHEVTEGNRHVLKLGAIDIEADHPWLVESQEAKFDTDAPGHIGQVEPGQRIVIAKRGGTDAAILPRYAEAILADQSGRYDIPFAEQISAQLCIIAHLVSHDRNHRGKAGDFQGRLVRCDGLGGGIQGAEYQAKAQTNHGRNGTAERKLHGHHERNCQTGHNLGHTGIIQAKSAMTTKALEQQY